MFRFKKKKKSRYLWVKKRGIVLWMAMVAGRKADATTCVFGRKAGIRALQVTIAAKNMGVQVWLSMPFLETGTPWRWSQVHHALAGRVYDRFVPELHHNTMSRLWSDTRNYKETLEALERANDDPSQYRLDPQFRTQLWWTCWDHSGREADRKRVLDAVPVRRYHRRDDPQILYTESYVS